MKIFQLFIYCCILLLAGCSQNQHQHINPQIQHDQKKASNPSDTSQGQQGLTIQEIISDAKIGKVTNIPFTLNQASISDVKKVWGHPDHVDFIANGNFATYAKRHVVFGYTKEEKIFDIRSYDPSLQNFTLSYIKAILGNPTKTTVNGEDTIYTYEINTRYQLKWIIPSGKGKVDHISVYSQNDLSQPKIPYILPIKGVSQKLSVTAWQSMQKWRQDILAFPKANPNDVFVNGPNKKMVALTFDDGPDLINTPKIVEALKQANVRGTFFFIGEKVQKYPDVVKAAYENGYIIGSHSFFHHRLTLETATEIQRDLTETSESIRHVIGKAPALFRPPYGETDSKLVNVAEAQNDKVIIWSLDTLDWSQREQSHIEENVFDYVRNGDIILMHSNEDKTETAKALPFIIKGLKQRGFQIVDIATLLNTNAYK
ncbi:MAG: DUF4309 domain-containing protein [Bacillota bacterium]|nr:DUF4309 domain-containing protein [Bacillota bacterium]